MGILNAKCLVAAIAAAAIVNVQAETVFEDNFAGKSERDGWFLLGTNGASAGVENGIMSVAGAVQHKAIVRPFKPVTLKNVGDSIKLSFTVHMLDVSNQGLMVRYGFYNSNGPQAERDMPGNDGGVLRNNQGYSAWVGDGNATWNRYAFERGGGFGVLAGNDLVNITCSNEGGWRFTRAFQKGTDHKVEFTVTKTADGVEIGNGIDGDVGGIDGAPAKISGGDMLLDTFDGVAFLNQRPTTRFGLRNVKVEYIPAN